MLNGKDSSVKVVKDVFTVILVFCQRGTENSQCCHRMCIPGLLQEERNQRRALCCEWAVLS